MLFLGHHCHELLCHYCLSFSVLWWVEGTKGLSQCLRGKESVCSAGDLHLIPGLGRSPGGVHDNPLQYSCMENPHGQRNLVGYNPWGCRVVHDWATTIIIIRIILYSTTYMVSVFPFTFLNLFWICYVFQYKKESIFMLFHVTIQLFLYYLLQWFLFSVYFRCHLGWSN